MTETHFPHRHYKKNGKIRSGILTPQELRKLAEKPCCFKVFMLLEEIKLLIMEREKWRQDFDNLKQKVKRDE
jgi:hypothetical protein